MTRLNTSALRTTSYPQALQLSRQPMRVNVASQQSTLAIIPEEIWCEIILPYLPNHTLSHMMSINRYFLALTSSHLWQTDDKAKQNQLFTRMRYRICQLSSHRNLPLTSPYHQSLTQLLPDLLSQHHFTLYSTPKIFWGTLYQLLLDENSENNNTIPPMINIMATKLYANQLHEMFAIYYQRFKRPPNQLKVTNYARANHHQSRYNVLLTYDPLSQANRHANTWCRNGLTYGLHNAQLAALKNKQLDHLALIINDLPLKQQAQLTNRLIEQFRSNHSITSAKALRLLGQCPIHLIRTSPLCERFSTTIGNLNYYQTRSFKHINQLAAKADFMCSHMSQLTPLERAKLVENLLNWTIYTHKELRYLGLHYLYRIYSYISITRHYNAILRQCLQSLSKRNATWQTQVNALKLLQAHHHYFPSDDYHQFHTLLRQKVNNRRLSLLGCSQAVILLLQANQPVNKTMLSTLITDLSSTSEPNYQQHINDLKELLLQAPSPLDQQALTALLSITHAPYQDPLAVQAVLAQLSEIKQLSSSNGSPKIDFQQVMHRFFENAPSNLWQNPPLDRPTCERIFTIFGEFNAFWNQYLDYLPNCINASHTHLHNVLTRHGRTGRYTTWHHSEPDDGHLASATPNLS